MNIKAKSIYVMGDVHGRIDKLNMFINKKQPDALILLGDCAFHWYEPEHNLYSGVSGFWLDDSNFKKVKPNDTKIFWLMGNHQAWDYMESTYGRIGKEPVEMSPNLFYCPIGSTLSINGKNCLFVGGADSTDIDTRVNRFEWFSEERLTESDYNYIDSITSHVDIMFSHTCPNEFDIQDKWDSIDRIEDPSRAILSKILNKYEPQYSFFGHWHRQKGGRYKNCQWQCLNTLSDGYSDQGRFTLDISEIFTI